MTPPGDVRPWVDKAEQDLLTGETMLRHARGAAPDTTCFVSQQCAEKYLKAFLVCHRVPFPRIHALDALLDLVVQIDPTLESLRPALVTMTPFAVEYRYPGESATNAEAEKAVAYARQVRDEIRARLGLHV